MTRVVFVAKSREARSQLMKLTKIGLVPLLVGAGREAAALINATAGSELESIKLVIVADGTGDRRCSIDDMKYIRQVSKVPMIFMSEEERENFDFDFNKNRVEFIRTPAHTSRLAEAIARIADE